MTDRYRKALEDLRERCAQEAERITARRRTLAGLMNSEAVKPCEVAAAIRKIDVQRYYECVAKEIEQLRAEVAECKRVAAAQAELHGEAEERAERLVEVLRGWWKAHRPVGWTEDQHRSCPHVNLVTNAEKALAAALLERLGEGEPR